MWPLLIRNVLLPLHERVLSRATFSIWRQLESHPSPDLDTLRDLQSKGLKQLLDHAIRNIPYWRERLEGRLATSDSADPAALLVKVPVLTRAAIGRQREQMRWPTPRGKVLVHISGGTTDDNLIFYWGRARQSWDRAMRYRGLARHGVFPGDRILHLWPGYPDSARLVWLKRGLRTFRDWLTNDLVLDLRPFSRARLDAVLARCVSYRPVLLIGYPSWLMKLGEHVRAVHPRHRQPALRLILCTGEVLFDFQRRFIEETFGVRVIQEYGSQDAGLIAHEDPAGALRLNAEQMIVEVLRNGRPAPPGELGEVVITHFHTPMMPFIRYATGDIVRQPELVTTDARAAGLPLFPLPEGRTSDQLVRDDGVLCPMRPVVEALVERAGLREFSLHQTAADKVECLTLAERDDQEPRRGEAEEVLRAFLGRSLRVQWHTGTEFVPFYSGKRRFVCSPVALMLLAHDQESGMAQARSWPQRLLQEATGGA